jgi:DNA-binding response OmpR family regulator
MARPRILVIEDDPAIREGLADALELEGFVVLQAADGRSGMELALEEEYDLLLLDLVLPFRDGLEILEAVRAGRPTVPVIALTARGEEADRVRGLRLGADDYVVKPFSLKELAARAKVALRRNSGAAEPPQGYRDENWEIEFDAYVVRYKGQEIRLTHKEFELFRYLVERASRVLTRERLLERVWGWESDIDARSIDAHIRRLRLKLGEARHHVETVVGLGYRFVK